jgi:cyclic di-GMP phosphodiesterase Gmr
VDLRTGKVCSAEALLRWHSLEKGTVSPAAFIPYAEESGLIIPLGRWVIHEAARQLQEWRSQGLDIRVAINMSARQLCHESIITDFSDALLNHRLAPSLIDIELTESCLVENEELALQRIDRFKELGCEVHLDDFGTGYSSLSQLGRLPIDVLKLDRSFISSMVDDTKAKALTRSMVAVAQELGLCVIAEGVETEAQASYLKELGVDMAQGYLYSRPLSAAEFKQWHASAQGLRLVAASVTKAQAGAA